MSSHPFIPHQTRRRFQWLVTYFLVRVWPKAEAGAREYFGPDNWKMLRRYGHTLLGILALYGVGIFLMGLAFFLDRLIHLLHP